IEDLATCLGRCLTGFGDDTGLAFAAAADCLDAAGPDAACRDLLGCVPPAPPPVDCDAFCGALTDCRIDAADCLADCRAAPDRVAAACTLDARRNGQRCRGVAACVGYVPPPADAVCRDLCDRVSACDRDVDAFLCRRDCTPTPPEVIAQQACAELADCGTLADCLALEADPLADCVRLCGPAVACGLFADPDVCAAVCTGRDASPRTPPTYTEHAADCLDAAQNGGRCDRDAAASCLDPVGCELDDDLIFADSAGGLIDVNINGRADNYVGGCGASAGPEQIIAITFAEPVDVIFEIAAADYDTLLYLRAPCDGADAEIDCNDDHFDDPPLPDGLWSRLHLQLDPGTYFLFVEGYNGQTGRATISIDVNPLP
ncbi:MAG: hypothetical protein KC620_18010, partial [Myxococcales bacterium]|nr:hypothetical protein [Myxococcales bacterium]